MHLGLCGDWLVDTNERGYIQDFVEDFPTLGWGKMRERSSRGKIEMVCRHLVKTSIKINARVMTSLGLILPIR
jgi:hypothetical protein